MKSFVLGIVATLVGLAAGAWIYFGTGMAPVATSAPPMPLETTFAKMALHARIQREMPKAAPLAADENAYLAGVPIYREDCAVGHGLPQQDKTAVADGMFPRPPQLFFRKGVSDDPPGETYWKVTNGIRLTGMPAFQNTLSDTARWQVSLLLANSNHLPPAVTSLLAAPLPKD